MTYANRLLVLSLKHSLLLFGARNTGKSTLLKKIFLDLKDSCLWIDLLDPDEEERYSREPNRLKDEVLALPEGVKYIVIDEIQKNPKLLDIIHSLIEKTKKIFVMTGSSARKLRYGGANLLAGRALIYNLYPFTSLEIGENFSLDKALRFGTLPAVVYNMETEEEKIKFLQAYSQTYLKEEIWLEQFIKKLDVFRKFLEIAAQCNGEIVNYAKIARDVGIEDKTVKQYFIILEDTLVGFFLEAFHNSFRKKLISRPKFYFFDPGVSRSLSRTLSVPLIPRTNAYGKAFEHFIIVECIRLASYYFSEFKFSYLKTKDDAEIDLIVERPGKNVLFIEIKSSNNVIVEKLNTFCNLAKDFGDCEAVCFSQDKRSRKYKNIMILPWQEGVKKYFMGELSVRTTI